MRTVIAIAYEYACKGPLQAFAIFYGFGAVVTAIIFLLIAIL